MNYNALLLLDKHHKNMNNFSNNNPNINHLTSSQKNYSYINIRTKENKKNEKFYSVKPYLYMMPKDIKLRDIFYTSIKSSKLYIKKYNLNNNTTNNGNIDREYIFKKIKKFIMINRINYNIFSKTIFLYDLLNFEIEKESMKNKKLSKFCSLQNMSIALIAFILTLKFNYVENKVISLKKILRNFEERNGYIKFNKVCEMEIMALKLINYNLTFQTPFSFMELFLINGILFSEDYIQYDLSYEIYDLVNETLEKIMETSNDYFKYNYFYLSCSVIMYIREKFKVSRWPKALEVTFDVSVDQFYDIYYTFFIRNNKKDNNNKNKIKSSYTSDIINISNLKSMNNIISVLKIMRNADKYRRTKGGVNKLDIFNNKNDKEENYKDNKNNNNNNNANINCLNKIKVGLKKNWNFSTYKSPKNFDIIKTTVSSSFIITNEGNKNNSHENKFNSSNKNNINDIDNKNEEEKILMNTNSDEVIKKGSFKVLENSSIYKAKSHKETLRSVSIFNYKEIENKTSENENEEKYNESYGIEELTEIKSININSNELTKKGSFKIIENSKINTTKICNKYKKNIISKNHTENYNTNNNKDNCNIYHKCNINSNLEPYYSNNTLNINIYKKRNYIDKKGTDLFKSCPEINKEIKNNNIHSSKINPISYKYNNINNKINNRYFNNFTEKKRNLELNNNNNNLNVNQTSFNDFLFYKNKLKNQNSNNDIDKENYLDKFKLKNKEENSNALTCESSNVKVSLNDFSIRKSYRYKKKYTKNESTKEEKLDLSPKNERNKKEVRKVLEKNKSFNKLLNNKIPFSDNTYNRKTGVRKYYKQKNSREYH